jgi:hypothetical protein
LEYVVIFIVSISRLSYNTGEKPIFSSPYHIQYETCVLLFFFLFFFRWGMYISERELYSIMVELLMLIPIFLYAKNTCLIFLYIHDLFLFLFFLNTIKGLENPLFICFSLFSRRVYWAICLRCRVVHVNLILFVFLTKCDVMCMCVFAIDIADVTSINENFLAPINSATELCLYILLIESKKRKWILSCYFVCVCTLWIKSILIYLYIHINLNFFITCIIFLCVCNFGRWK